MDSNKSRARAKANGTFKRSSEKKEKKVFAGEVSAKEIMRTELKAEIIEQAKKVKQNYYLSGIAQAKYRESLGKLESLKAAATIIGITFEKPESYNDYL